MHPGKMRMATEGQLKTLSSEDRGIFVSSLDEVRRRRGEEEDKMKSRTEMIRERVMRGGATIGLSRSS